MLHPVLRHNELQHLDLAALPTGPHPQQSKYIVYRCVFRSLHDLSLASISFKSYSKDIYYMPIERISFKNSLRDEIIF